MSLLKPSRWPVSPGLISPQWQWAWEGLVVLIPFWEGSGPPVDYITGKKGVYSGTTASYWVNDQRGMAPFFDNYEFYWDFDHVPQQAPEPISMLWIGGSRAALGGAENHRPLRICQTDSSQSNWLIDFADNLAGDPARWAQAEAIVNFEQPYSITRTYASAMSFPGPNSSPFRVWVDGKYMGASSGASWNDIAGTVRIHIGAHSYITQNLDGPVLLFAMWNRVLTDDEMRLLTSDPYGFLRPSGTLILSPAGTVFQYYRPSGDILGTGWETAPTPSQDLYAQIDEVEPSSTDYIYPVGS